MKSETNKLRSECFEALTCLFIAVDRPVAHDLNSKVRAYIKELESELESNVKMRSDMLAAPENQDPV